MCKWLDRETQGRAESVALRLPPGLLTLSPCESTSSLWGSVPCCSARHRPLRRLRQARWSAPTARPSPRATSTPAPSTGRGGRCAGDGTPMVRPRPLLMAARRGDYRHSEEQSTIVAMCRVETGSNLVDIVGPASARTSAIDSRGPRSVGLLDGSALRLAVVDGVLLVGNPETLDLVHAGVIVHHRLHIRISPLVLTALDDDVFCGAGLENHAR